MARAYGGPTIPPTDARGEFAPDAEVLREVMQWCFELIYQGPHVVLTLLWFVYEAEGWSCEDSLLTSVACYGNASLATVAYSTGQSPERLIGTLCLLHEHGFVDLDLTIGPGECDYEFFIGKLVQHICALQSGRNAP